MTGGGKHGTFLISEVYGLPVKDPVKADAMIFLFLTVRQFFNVCLMPLGKNLKEILL
ncbi:hypothetical protein FACS1894172_16700 [Spirochaetia bacterium]|nr:hypothetical protein FACS1894172_16700 [Spirochaetia bacterium]